MLEVFRIAFNTPYELKVGDPDFIGWSITASYVVAFVTCVLNAMAVRRIRLSESKSRLYLFWVGLSCVVFLLGLNKQLDVQTWMITVCRTLARENGWYEQRREYQAYFIFLVVCCGAVSSAWVTYQLRSVWRECMVAIVGLAVLGTFLLVRAASLHQLDGWLAGAICGVKLRYLFELLGVATICLAACESKLRHGKPLRRK